MYTAIFIITLKLLRQIMRYRRRVCGARKRTRNNSITQPHTIFDHNAGYFSWCFIKETKLAV